MDIYINLLLCERIIALFNNMRTLKFKTKVTIVRFTLPLIVTVFQKQKQANAANGSKSANHEPGA